MPSLPPELWRAVIRELAYAYPLDIGYNPLAEDSIYYYGPMAEVQAQMQRNLYSAVLVCKTWHNIALPILYSYGVLLIQSISRARMLCDILSAPAGDDEHTLDRGAFVRHICIRLPEIGLRDVETDTVDKVIARIIRCCPNLAIFTYRRHAKRDILCSAFDAILSSAAARSLRKLDLGTHSSFSHRVLWELASEEVGRLPMLETLVVPPTLRDFHPWLDPSGPRMPTRAMSVARLGTLVVPWDVYLLMLSHLSELYMPVLQAVHILPLIEVPSHTLFTQQSSAEKHEMNRKVMSIGFDRPAAWSSANLLACFALLSHFPKLRSMRLKVDDIMSVPHHHLEHPSLAYIAIVQRYVRGWPGLSQSDVAATDTTINLILEGHFPMLHTVQITRSYAGFYQEEMRLVNMWTQRLGERGIGLEFSA